MLRRWRRARALRRIRNARLAADALRRQWDEDPLSHPVIRKMSRRELADLPMTRNRVPPG
ncbi:hypothetical protein CVM50_19700 [Pseudooceanicola marinus]|nr:hypothetical protein CVM50_19700 [Pseudooceanicola marinus]